MSLFGDLWFREMLRFEQTSTDLIKQVAILVALANLAFARTLAVTDERSRAVEDFEAERAAKSGLDVCMLEMAHQVYAHLREKQNKLASQHFRE